MDRNITQIIFAGRNLVEVTDDVVSVPVPEHGAVVETLYSCISAGTELAKLTGLQTVLYPCGMGNRAVGRVLEVGGSNGRVQAGDLVFCHTPHASIASAEGLLVPLPEELDRPETALIGMASVAITGVRVAQPEIGDTAVVLGGGLVGQFAAQLLMVAGIRTILVDQTQARLSVARECGIAHVVDSSASSAPEEVLELTGGQGAEHVLDCTGAPSAVLLAPAMARQGGQIILVGSPRGRTEVDLTEFLNAFHLCRPHGDLTLKGAHEWKIPLWPIPGVKHSQERNIQILTNLIRDSRLHLGPLLSGVFQPEDAGKAYGMLLNTPTNYLGIVFDWTRK